MYLNPLIVPAQKRPDYTGFKPASYMIEYKELFKGLPILLPCFSGK
jgi:hypothetical protein